MSVPSDVARLVVAARIVAHEDQGPEAIRELDRAAEAFASRVPWDGEPEPPRLRLVPKSCSWVHQEPQRKAYLNDLHPIDASGHYDLASQLCTEAETQGDEMPDPDENAAEEIEAPQGETGDAVALQNANGDDEEQAEEA